MRITQEEAQRAADAYKVHGTERKAAASLKLAKTTFHRHLCKAGELGLCGTEPVIPGFEIKKTTAQYDGEGNLKGEHIQQHKAAGDVFELPPGQVLRGVSAYVDAEGRTRSKWIKTKADSITADLTEVLKAEFSEHKGRSKLVPAPRRIDRDLLSVYPIADQHNGLLAWGRETGESYDLKIGEQRLLDCTSRLVAQSPRSKHAIILNLGDWYHANDPRNATPRSGHILDVDGRWYKVITTGVRMMMRIIDLNLARHERVIVRNIPGNHDPEAARVLTIALAAFYSNNKRVTVVDDPGDFFFHRFGNTLIGATHGHNMKPDKMAMTMAVDRAEDWGNTKYRVFYFGHIHHETAKEVAGVRIESFQTLAAKDAYATSGGYRSGQSLSSITFHRTAGEIGRHRINI